MSMAVKTTTVELGNSSSTCRMCGTAYGKMNGYFYKSNANLYKGVGYLPICKRCVDYMYENYLAECGSARDAARQLCRKLDLYWDESMFNAAEKNNTSRSAMTSYITRLTAYKHADKCYDDTLRAEGTLWEFADTREAKLKQLQQEKQEKIEAEIASIEAELAAKEEAAEAAEPVPEEVKADWGSGYSDAMYRELEQRRQYWMEHLVAEGVDMNKAGTQALLRQIVQTELDINKGRASGEDVDKRVNTFKGLLSDAMLKPSQNKSEDSGIDNTPLGVWAWRYENKRPIPEVDEKCKDVNGLRKYITIWFKGHLAKMVGLRNSYSQLYEDEIKRLSVEKSESEDDLDDSFFAEIFNESDSEGF